MNSRTIRYQRWTLGICSVISFSLPVGVSASDHDDSPLLKTIPRHDARLTDIFVFTRGDRLVIPICLDPTIPATATSYQFAADLTVKIYIDRNSAVSFDDPDDLAEYGGTIVQPERIREDITFEITFDAAGVPHLETVGLLGPGRNDVRLFTGLRDDPFIRGPRIGKNSAAIVVDVPLRAVMQGRPHPLLVWATTKIGAVNGPMVDLGGRSLRSQFVENDLLNNRPPSQHATDMDMHPDVVIFDHTRPAAFPNGRELIDDVVDLVGDARVLNTDAPFPAANDKAFLDEFPYLAAPHAP